MKQYLLRFLPYLENAEGKRAEDLLGITRRAWGCVEENYATRDQAMARFSCARALGVVETAEVYEHTPGPGAGVLVFEYAETAEVECSWCGAHVNASEIDSETAGEDVCHACVMQEKGRGNV